MYARVALDDVEPFDHSALPKRGTVAFVPEHWLGEYW